MTLRELLMNSGTWAEDHLRTGLKDDLIQAEKRLASLKKRAVELREFIAWRKALINGETMAGSFGCSPTYTFMVTRYALVTPARKGRVADIAEVDLIIVPDMLVAHDLRVNIPTDKPNVFTNTSREVDVPGIVARMKARCGKATNVSMGGFDDGLTETCHICGAVALMLGMDEHQDDDNGRTFLIGRHCSSCQRVETIGSFSEFKDGDQYGRTDAIYRK